MQHRIALCPVMFAVLLGLSSAVKLKAVSAAGVSSQGDTAAAWAEVDRLISDRSLEEASRKLETLLEAARAAGDEEGWTRALVRATLVRLELARPEAAVRFLKERPWPPGALSRSVLDLFYAHSLVVYARVYSWEILQRERVVTRDESALDQWTQAQIGEAAGSAFREVWSHRQDLGGSPISRWASYLNANDYPPGIRGTLRDAVSYLFVEQLADTSFWSPGENEEVYELDLPALIRGEGGPRADEIVADPASHPLVKLAAILSDLEAWHLAAGEREAALEARLARLRRLTSAFSSDEDRSLVRRAVEESLASARDLPWWSMGMATLADLVLSSETPHRLERAHEIARAGESAFPESAGGIRCRSIRQQIEAPDFYLQAMCGDGLGRRSMQLSHRNLRALYFRAFAVDLWAQAEKKPQLDLQIDKDELKELLSTGSAVAAWRTELPETPDFDSHTTWVVPPIDHPGAYVIVASPREDFALADNRLVTLRLVLGDLVLVVRHNDAENGLDALALSGATGDPIPGVEVQLFQTSWRPGEGLPRVATQTSGADGSVRFAFAPKANRQILLGRKGGEPALVDGVYPTTSAPVGEIRSSLLYTDRAVYRPQQKVLWKVLAYAGRPQEGRFAVAAGQLVTVALRDPTGQKVAEQVVTTNEFGTASGEFQIPAGRPLGSWQIVSGGEVPDSPQGAAYVQVEEYKRPTFEAVLDDPAEPLRLNRPAKLSGHGQYYFGLPVTRGEVRWRVTREPLFPWWWNGLVFDRVSVVASGRASLSPQGTFEVALTPRGDERMGPQLTYGFRISAEVTDDGGETRQVERRFRMGLVSVEALIAGRPAFLRAGRRASLTVTRSDLNGVPRRGTGTWTLYELSQPARVLLPAELPVPAPAANEFLRPGDMQRGRFDFDTTPARILAGWLDGRRIAGGRAHHGATGEAAVELPPLRSGAYRLRYETTDDFGARVEAQRELIVAGRKMRLSLPAVLEVETPSVRVGETARVLVHSGLPGQTLFFEIDRDGKPIERRTLVAGESPSLIEIPIGEKDRGGLGFKLLVMRDHQLFDRSATLAVPWEDRALQVRFSSFRDKIRPGGRETWRVTVQGPTGPSGAPEAAAAELLASMTDRSLDLFAPYRPPDPLSVYPDRSRVTSGAASLGYQMAYQILPDTWSRFTVVPDLRPDRLRFFDGLSFGARQWAVFEDMVISGDRVSQTVIINSNSVPWQTRRISTASTGPRYYDFDAFEEMNAGGVRGGAAGGAGAPPTHELRSNFAETALWLPHLLTGPDGTATLEFVVPDSVTSWNVWVHAVTRDLRAGSVSKETRSAKELLVRPYLPRFLREGDRAEVKVVVNNSGNKPMKGEVVLDVLDPDTEASLLSDFSLPPGASRLPFTVAAGSETSVTFPLTAPRRVGPVAFKVTAVAGDLSDGELRPLPILPSRVQLMQSRFVIFRGAEQRTLRFEDLEKDDDPTRRQEALVVTLDAQLFDGVLAALPYLIAYPYECTEQTLNRFLSTGIVSSLFDRYPAVASRAAELAKRDTRLETWDAADPNRKLTLEETPFLPAAQGGGEKDLIKVLDPRIARAERDTALGKLAQAQLPDGAFPWWPGGPASPYMTAYLISGLARAAEFGIEVPKQSVLKAWTWLAKYTRDENDRRLSDVGCCWELLTYINYVASSYPDPSWLGDAFLSGERERMLAVSFDHWREQSLYARALLALTLKRMGRTGDARLVFDSVMNEAKTTPEEGTFWQPEDRSWLWYNDTIETHAFVLRALLEIQPEDPRRHGLVQWLFLHKQLNHWHSTRATAEVLYALAHYLKAEGQLDVREEATVRVGGQATSFVFEPDRYTGKENRLIIPGEKIEPSRSAVVVEKATSGFLYAAATWHFSTEQPPQEGRGDLFQISRRYFLRVQEGKESVLRPLAEGAVLAPGDEVEVQLSLRSRMPAEYVHLRDPRPAGLEPGAATSGWKWNLGVAFYEEIRDSATSLFVENLPAGEYTFKIRLHANLAGTFRVAPATVQSMYAPELTAYSAGDVVRVGQGQEQ